MLNLNAKSKSLGETKYLCNMQIYTNVQIQSQELVLCLQNQTQYIGEINIFTLLVDVCMPLQ